MNLLKHFIISAILTIALWPFFGIYSLLAMVSGYLIDSDHYLLYIYKFRDINLKRAYKHLTTPGILTKKDLFLFHSIEFMIPGVIFISQPFMPPLLISFFVHIVLDIVEEVFILKKNIKAFSLIRWIYIRR